MCTRQEASVVVTGAALVLSLAATYGDALPAVDSGVASVVAGAASEETCCSRDVVLDFTGPDGKSTDLSRFASSYWAKLMIQRLGSGSKELGYMKDDCPLKLMLIGLKVSYTIEDLELTVDEATGNVAGKIVIRAVDREAECDYAFRGVLTEEDTDKTIQRHAIDLKLVDIHRGTIIKQYKIRWPIPPEWIVLGGWQTAMEPPLDELALQFKNINKVLHEYEGMPETATVTPERETMTAGKTYTVELSGILDSYGKPAKPWQYVLVKADKGTVVEGANGVPQYGGHWRFPVGNGSIQFKYRAPEECKEQTDTIRVWNSCYNDPARHPNLPADQQIGQADVKIRCYQGELVFEFNWEATCEDPEAWGHGSFTNRGVLPFFIDFDEEPPRFTAIGTYDLKNVGTGGPIPLGPITFVKKPPMRATGTVEMPDTGPWNLVIDELDDLAGHRLKMGVVVPLVDGEVRNVPTPFKEMAESFPNCRLDKEESTVTVHLKKPAAGN